MFWVRFRSSVLLMAVTLTAMVLGGPVLFGIVMVISLIGMMELYRVLGLHRSLPGMMGYLMCIGYSFLIYFHQEEYLFAAVIAFFLILMLVYVLTFPKYRSEQVTMVFFGFFYVAVMLSYVWQIRFLDGGAFLVWLVFIGAWGSDTCAYLVGSAIGKHKIAPKLSPKKSVEGFFGGIAGAALLGGIYAVIVADKLVLFSNPVLACAVMGAASSVISQLGDWAASAIKRNYDIKDYGKLIPGHGGIMDRFDSVLFTAPIIFYLAQLFSALSAR